MNRVRSLLILAAFLGSTSTLAGVYDDMLNALTTKDVGQVRSLLLRGMDVNTTDQNGNSLLMLAAQNGDFPMLEMLLRNKPNILRKNKYGDSALMLAAIRGDLKSVVALVAAGAEIDPEGWTPLIYAAFEGQTEVVRFLLTLDIDIDAQAANGMTALMAAARNGNLEIVRILLEQEADVHLVNQDGKTALELARIGKHAEIVGLLENAGRR